VGFKVSARKCFVATNPAEETFKERKLLDNRFKRRLRGGQGGKGDKVTGLVKKGMLVNSSRLTNPESPSKGRKKVREPERDLC